MVNPSTWNVADAVERDDTIRCKEGIEEQTEDTTDCVLSEQIERIIYADQELD